MFSNDIYMGIVYDSMRILGRNYNDFYINISPKAGYTSIIQGPCFTTYGEVVNVSQSEYEVLDNIRLQFYRKHHFMNKPIVLLQANDTKVAHSGDITSLIYKKLGASGFITDGNVRDMDIIDKMKFPVFCKGQNPIDALGYWALTKYQTEIEIMGVKIKPDDYCFASKDGVIVVPNNLIKQFKPIAAEQLERENNIRFLINNKEIDFEEIVKEMGRW